MNYTVKTMNQDAAQGHSQFAEVVAFLTIPELDQALKRIDPFAAVPAVAVVMPYLQRHVHSMDAATDMVFLRTEQGRVPNPSPAVPILLSNIRELVGFFDVPGREQAVDAVLRRYIIQRRYGFNVFKENDASINAEEREEDGEGEEDG
ncbi:hypothetical protein BCR44DRAFT_1425617, partial [Catenaria anguillulae PL171]